MDSSIPQARNIDYSLGMTSANQRATIAGNQREDMTGSKCHARRIVGLWLCGLYARDPQLKMPVVTARLNRNGKCCFMP